MKRKFDDVTAIGSVALQAVEAGNARASRIPITRYQVKGTIRRRTDTRTNSGPSIFTGQPTKLSHSLEPTICGPSRTQIISNPSFSSGQSIWRRGRFFSGKGRDERSEGVLRGDVTGVVAGRGYRKQENEVQMGADGSSH